MQILRAPPPSPPHRQMHTHTRTQSGGEKGAREPAYITAAVGNAGELEEIFTGQYKRKILRCVRASSGYVTEQSRAQCSGGEGSEHGSSGPNDPSLEDEILCDTSLAVQT
uniref:Uncharacterized protein n=1 Tax=Knipowitschia caucasica TaxID=637954 RepID=A0AAV2JFA8_KNICA